MRPSTINDINLVLVVMVGYQKYIQRVGFRLKPASQLASSNLFRYSQYIYVVAGEPHAVRSFCVVVIRFSRNYPSCDRV